MKWRCLLRLLCPLRSPITTLDFVLLKNESLVFALRLGPEIKSRSRLWVLPRARHLAHCWLSNQRRIFLRIFCQETPMDGSGPTNFRTEPSPANLTAISFPCNPACPESTSNCPQQILVLYPFAGRGILAAGGLRGLIYAILLVYNMLIS